MQRRCANTGFSGQNTFIFLFYFWAVLLPSLWGEQISIVNIIYVNVICA